MNELDPFALLGVTIDSSPEEAKSAFRAIALVVHPDKGGSPEEMKVLIKSYKFVMRQLNLVNRTKVVDDLEKEFADFCRSQKDEDLDLRSRELRELIMGEEAANAMEAEDEFREKFNAEFEERLKASSMKRDEEEEEEDRLITQAFLPLSTQEGYGESMMKSEYTSSTIKYEDLPQARMLPPPPLPLPSVDLTKNALHPECSLALVVNIQLGRIYGNARPSVNQHASDYAEAFRPLESIGAVVDDMSSTLEERLDRLKLDRAYIPT